jgi:hypothetical protein
MGGAILSKPWAQHTFIHGADAEGFFFLLVLETKNKAILSQTLPPSPLCLGLTQ